MAGVHEQAKLQQKEEQYGSQAMQLHQEEDEHMRILAARHEAEMAGLHQKFAEVPPTSF